MDVRDIISYVVSVPADRILDQRKNAATLLRQLLLQVADKMIATKFNPYSVQNLDFKV